VASHSPSIASTPTALSNGIGMDSLICLYSNPCD
jgi:hypothetical protein